MNIEKTWEDFLINQVVSNINEYWEDMVRLGRIWEDFQINQVVSNINEYWEDMGRFPNKLVSFKY